MDLSSASVSIISATSAISVSTSSSSTSSTTISLPSSSRTTAAFAAFPSDFAAAGAATTGAGGGAISASCALDKIRADVPRPALRAFSDSVAITSSRWRASWARLCSRSSSRVEPQRG